MIKVIQISQDWKIAIDPENAGKLKQWFAAIPESQVKDAIVPGVIQQVYPDYYGVAWYWNQIGSTFPSESGQRILLKFERVDYFAQVWLNGQYLGEHEGGEGAFEFDISAGLSPAGNNLLAVRVINPMNESIDGLILKQTPHTFRKIPYNPGAAFNCGGIMGSVEISRQPLVRILDVFAIADCRQKRIRVQCTLENSTGRPADCIYRINAGPAGSAQLIDSCRETLAVSPGISQLTEELHIPEPVVWSPGNPYLYRVAAEIEPSKETSADQAHQFCVRTGFREFRVREDGFFELNGKRLFLKSAHTVNNFPIGLNIPHDPDIQIRELLLAKAMGYDMIRFLGGIAFQRQLDFCDEAGLLVYEENLAAWCLEDSPQLSERFNQSLRAMILRDRNHPCIVIWGLLNETWDNPTFRHAVTTLPLVREMDQTRLVLLSSGRFDRQSVGSVSNPGTDVWQALWGCEADAVLSEKKIAEEVTAEQRWQGFRPFVGDLHTYPRVPHNSEIIAWLRNIGRDSKPVFLSEYGIGSLVNAIRVKGLYEQAGARPDLADYQLHKKCAEKYLADWEKYGIKDVYPDPEDLLLASERLHAEHRKLGYTALRSNPGICGYSLTGIIDQPCGEGLLTSWREPKQGIIDAMRGSLAPLRWCLFVAPGHAYAGKAIRIEALLVNDDILKPGKYPLRLQVWGPNGTVWEKSLDLVIDQPQEGRELPFVQPVLSEEIVIKGQSGRYCFTAHLLRGGAPACSQLDFHLSRPAVSRRNTGEVAVLGIDQPTRRWLANHGIRSHDYDRGGNAASQVILIGDPGDAPLTDTDWQKLTDRITRGSAAVFLNPGIFKRDDDLTGWLPLGNRGQLTRRRDWVYRIECVAKRHPIFARLPAPGIMDFRYFGQTLPEYFFEGLDIPDDLAAVAFAPGYNCPDSYFSGLINGSYRLGQGWLTLNTIKLLENRDLNPAADQMILNLIREAALKIVTIQE